MNNLLNLHSHTSCTLHAHTVLCTLIIMFVWVDRYVIRWLVELVWIVVTTLPGFKMLVCVWERGGLHLTPG